MSRFRDRVRKGLDRIDSHAGETVEYRRGETIIEDLLVVPGATELEVINSEGLTTYRRTRDFKINACDLVLALERSEPAAGDLIIDCSGEETVVFEVFSPGGAERPWRWADQGRTRYRVHTREIKADC